MGNKFLFALYCKRKNDATTKTDEEILTGHHDEIAYDHLLQVIKGNTYADIVYIANKSRSKDQELYETTIRRRMIAACRQEALEQERTVDDIAKEINRHRYRAGLQPLPPSHFQPLGTDTAWKPEEDRQLRVLKENGWSWSDIDFEMPWRSWYGKFGRWHHHLSPAAQARKAARRHNAQAEAASEMQGDSSSTDTSSQSLSPSPEPSTAQSHNSSIDAPDPDPNDTPIRSQQYDAENDVKFKIWFLRKYTYPTWLDDHNYLQDKERRGEIVWPDEEEELSHWTNIVEREKAEIASLGGIIDWDAPMPVFHWC